MDDVIQIEDRRATRAFGLVYRADIDHPDFRALTTGARLTYIALATYANSQTGEAWPTQATLARVTGLTERSIRRAVADLEGAGYLIVHTRQYGMRRSNTYILIPKGQP
jgi:hypothetical protein